MTGETLYPRLEPLLAQIQKPIQYVGGELNAQVKPWDGAAVHWALMYPDAYEVGLPNQGLMILYEVLNERPDALAERTYAVWPDLAALMRENGVPQFTVDGHRAVADFDLLGVSFATELGYTNLLEALDLAGIPLHAVDRDETPPGRRRRRARRVQPRAGRRLRRLRRPRRRRAGRRRHHRRRPRLEGAGQARRPGRAAGPPRPGRRRLRAALLRRQLRPGRRHRGGPRAPGTTSPRGSASAPSWTSTSGPTRRRRSCRWPRACTSG